jgi:hypothetical protein
MYGTLVLHLYIGVYWIFGPVWGGGGNLIYVDEGSGGNYNGFGGLIWDF